MYIAKFSRLALMLLLTTLSFSLLACKGEPPEPPLKMGVAQQVGEGLEFTVEAFEISAPDFVTAKKQAMRPQEGNEKVAVVRLKITNTGDIPRIYSSLHKKSAAEGVQLCTMPDPETGARSNVERVMFKEEIYSTNQQFSDRVELAPGAVIHDDYLFKIPNFTDPQLVVLVPGTIVGEPKTVYRFSVPNPPQEVVAQPPAQLEEAFEIDNLSVVVTKLEDVYAELAQSATNAPKLKYPYAYTKDIVLALHMSITNNGNLPLSYDPGHAAALSAGINLQLAGTALKRVKLDSKAIGKGQVRGIIELKPGETYTDVYLFQSPASSGTLDFFISGHLFGVRGMYRYTLNYEKTTPEPPNLEPYKTEGAS
ncbi:MAG: hypothetical protein WC966_12490 [Bradymonadales bacterium]|jgi:hypothetical protein